MSKRNVIVSIVVAVAAVGGLAAWKLGTAKSGPPVKMETAKLEKGRILAKVTASGTLSALVTVQVGSQVSGRIAELHADFNTPVKKGQLIAKIDPQLFSAAVEQARANLAAATGNLAKAKAQAADAARQAARSKALLDKKLVAQADYDTAQSTADASAAGVAAAEGTVAQTRAALHQAEVNLNYTNILSPTDGVVISRSVDVGQTVAASLQAPTLFVIAEDLKRMQVDTSVAEADVGRLREGMDASFTVDAYPAEVFRGKVRQIRNAPTTVQNVVTYDAVVDVANPELKLKPGMTANVTFVYAEKEDVLKVPNAALRFRPPPNMLAESRPQGGGQAGAPAGQRAEGRPQGGGQPGAGPGGQRPSGGGMRGAEPPDRRTIWVMREEKPAPVRVRTGISDGSFTELVEGELKEGDVVVTDAQGPPSGFAQAMRRGL
ncbi:MAG: efflux RND transporter periplasmic adaptor subunit [Anaeromyxobacter sp.]